MKATSLTRLDNVVFLCLPDFHGQVSGIRKDPAV